MAINGIIKQPFTVGIDQASGHGHIKKGYAFVPKRFENELGRGEIDPGMVQLILRVDVEPKSEGISLQPEISMIMQDWLRLETGKTTRVEWEVFEGHEYGRSGVIEHDRRWIGVRMPDDSAFNLKWVNPWDGSERFHFFSFCVNQLYIGLNASIIVVPEEVEAFRKNPHLVSLMERLTR